VTDLTFAERIKTRRASLNLPQKEQSGELHSGRIPLLDLCLVTGQRTWQDVPTIWAFLDLHNPELVLHGGARGADSLASEWVHRRHKLEICIPILDKAKANHFSWEEHGLQAGTLRNCKLIDIAYEIIAETGAVGAVAFFKDDRQEAKGTNNCLNQAHQRQQMYHSIPELKRYAMPLINGWEWMETDLRASRPIDKLGMETEFMPIENPDG
jgi:hypothetical protein